MTNSTYAITNLMDVDGRGGPDESFEMRLGRKHLQSTELGVSYVRLAPGSRSPIAHRHKVQEEAYVVVSGGGRVKLDDEVLELKRWDVVRVGPRVVRRFEGGPDGMELVAVGGKRPEEGDGERVEGFWED